MELHIGSADAMEALGRRLAAACPPGGRIHLQGELGAGKTTLARGFLYGLGYRGKVKSPTYTLVEPYLIENQTVYHFDLYRIGDPEELEGIGLRDYLDGVSRCLVEWPERAGAVLDAADLGIEIHLCNASRQLRLVAGSKAGHKMLAALEDVT